MEETKSYLEMQMREKKMKEETNNTRERQFHKTHYGPEETFEVAQRIQSNLNESKAKINDDLQKQIRDNMYRKEKMKA